MKKTFTDLEISTLCRGLAQLLRAGAGMGDALALMADDEPNAFLRDVLQQMQRGADEGCPAAELFTQAGCFPPYVCGLLKVGEQTGRVEEALAALADYYDESASLKRRLRQQMLYPAVLLGVMLAVIVALLVWVLPIFDDVYARLGAGLTGVAGGLLRFGQWLTAALPWVLAVIALLAVTTAVCLTVPALKARCALPAKELMLGKSVSRKIRDARFAQAFCMCVRSGMDLQDALGLTASLSDDPTCADACEACIERMDSGENTAKALAASGLMPRSECRLLEAGLRSGAADEMLQRIAQRLLEDSNRSLEARAARIEPTLVLITGVLVGLILLSVMLPLMNIMSAIG
ncbi:MAG: type II secretion system F family protein [Clostridia bacterium]|nr:type II secretion system F family protein [Clostridia bacterium]